MEELTARVDGRGFELSPELGNSSWWVGQTPPLERGPHHLEVVARDRHRNSTFERRFIRVIEEVQPPTIELLEPAGNEVLAGEQRLRLRLEDLGSGLEPASIRVIFDGVQVALPPGAFDPDSGQLTCRLPAITSGSQHILLVDVADTEGNHAYLVHELIGRDAPP